MIALLLVQGRTSTVVYGTGAAEAKGASGVGAAPATALAALAALQSTKGLLSERVEAAAAAASAAFAAPAAAPDRVSLPAAPHEAGAAAAPDVVVVESTELAKKVTAARPREQLADNV